MGFYFSFPLTLLIEIILPFGVAFWIIRHYHTSWRLVGWGGVIYLASQMVYIPLLDGINSLYANHILTLPSGAQLILLNAVIGGIAGGLCEETIRLIGFKLLKKQAQNTGGAFSLGIGHAGIESIIIAGLPMLGTFISMVAYKNANLQDPTLDQATLAQIANLWQMPWLTPLAGALERMMAMITQVALAFMILQVFIRKSYWFFVAAILWHAFVNGLITGLIDTNIAGVAILGVEVVLGLCSTWILWRLLTKPKVDQPDISIEQMPV